MMAFVGCGTTLPFASPVTPSPTVLSTETVAVQSPMATSTSQPVSPGPVEHSPTPLLEPKVPTVARLDLTPTIVPATSTPTISPTPGSIVCLVGNTDGDGVYLRRTPNMDDRIKAWPDRTEMLVIGPDVRSQGRTWKSVQDPEENVGYVPAEYAICPDPTIQAESSPTHPPAQTSPSATATSIPSPTKVPTTTPTPTPVQAQVACPDGVPWHQAKMRVGERLSVIGPVVKTGYLRDRPGSPTVMELGRNLRDPDRFTVEIRGQDREKFATPPEHAYIGKTVCVTGWITEQNGIAGTVVRSPDQIVVVQTEPEE